MNALLHAGCALGLALLWRRVPDPSGWTLPVAAALAARA